MFKDNKERTADQMHDHFKPIRITVALKTAEIFDFKDLKTKIK